MKSLFIQTKRITVLKNIFKQNKLFILIKLIHSIHVDSLLFNYILNILTILVIFVLIIY